MHFDPDGIPEKELQTLREFARFLQRLQIIDVMDVEPGRRKGSRRKVCRKTPEAAGLSDKDRL